MSKNKQISSFFDKFSKDYDKLAFEQSLGTRYLSKIETNFVLENCPIKKRDRILDIGIGTGRCSSLLANQGAEIYGVDISDKMIKKAKLRLGESLIDIQTKNVQEGIPYPSNNFNIVLSIRSLKYMSEWKFVIKEISRVLKSNGLFILEISNKCSISFLGKKDANYLLFDLKEVTNTLKKEGFSIKHLKGGSKLPFFFYLKVNRNLLLNLLIFIENVLRFFLSSHFSRNILIEAQKMK